jgi:Domain of unknown function (DUF4190)
MQGGYPPAGGYGGQPYPVQARKTNGLAVASLVCSLAGFVIGVSAPVGAVLGHMALRQIRQTGEDGEGLAKAGIIIGWIITGLIVLGCCIAGIAIFAAAGSNSYR